ncbi:MAG: hypothetical protein NVSMB52_17870 [Chloroflexota bacterium]
MKRGLVVSILCALTIIILRAPFTDTPAPMRPFIGLGAFQACVVALSGGLILATLLFASHFAILWHSFLHPTSYRRAARDSLRICTFAVAGDTLLFLGFGLLIYFSLTANMEPPLPLFTIITKGLVSMMALIGVASAISLIRGLILLALTKRASLQEYSAS